MKLITNNPKFKEFEQKNLEVVFMDKSYIEILETVRDLVHKNYELMTHPLYGSVKPNETVYRSVVIKKGEKLDFNSANLISDAITTFNKFKKNKQTPNWTESVLDDFSVIDYDLISNSINRIFN